MNWINFDVGRRVVCLSVRMEWRLCCTAYPLQGTVYTIRATKLGRNLDDVELLGLRFEEFEAWDTGYACSPKDGYWWFAAKDFRPLDERRLEQFREMLAKPPKNTVAA